jgi:hypothetical protein
LGLKPLPKGVTCYPGLKPGVNGSEIVEYLNRRQN